MAKLSTTARNKLPSNTFALAGSRKYPVPDKPHAANAKARAAQQEAKGKISKATQEKIDAKANRVLGKNSRTQERHYARSKG
jgi:hypothetical protein